MYESIVINNYSLYDSQSYQLLFQPIKIVLVLYMKLIRTDCSVLSAKNYYLYFLQFFLKTEGFLSLAKTFSFSLKTEGNTNFSLKLKQKVFSRKPSVFFYKKLKEN